ncbi:hypothetical protein Tco_1145373 [Tanacetum coccineum]
MESNKSIHRSDEQKNLYKALVDAYESNKLILDTNGETVSFKRRQDEEDKDKEPFVGSNRGSKRRRAGKEPEPTSAPKEKTSKTTGKSTEGSKSHQKSVDESLSSRETNANYQRFGRTCTSGNKTFPDAHGPFQTLAKLLWPTMEDPRSPGPTFKLMRGSYKSLLELEYFFEEVYKATTDQLDWNNPEVEWHNYKHLDWITIRRDDDKLYTFKEGNFNRLRIQDIEDMLLLLVQGKLTNLTVEERLAFNVSLRMFTRSVVIQRRMEDLQLGVESYQKKLNLIKPDTYISDLKRKEAYSAYANLGGFISKQRQKNKLCVLDELYKFSDCTLNDVQTAINDLLKGIRMKHRYSNPMIQPELEGSTQGYPLVSVEVLRILKDGGEVKEFQRSFRHSDTERLSRSDEVLKLKNFKKDATLKLSKSTNQEWYEHVGPEVTRSQDDKVTRWRNEIMLG